MCSSDLHGTNAGQTTWFGLAREVYAAAGADPALVTPTTSAVLGRPAPRPAYSVLGHAGWARAHLPPMRHWRQALRAAWPYLADAAAAAPSPGGAR